ncbi:asparagine--tRNA ligase [uncultured Adlercreutzia sp.]|uniref:asparagine--tRNA ligase n=1 Tax=uncultured Adlercreutzia sp. TaxID=875803 RepID=UPI002675AD91|nr:asparagine--tRNA ligase [uncultured Adlercreutzia sp.]
MDRIKIAQLYADADRFDGERVTVAGWVKSVRDMKNFGFVTLNDGSCFKDLQIVMEREALANYDEIAHQNVSAALVATGVLRLTPDAPQPFELAAAEIRVEGPSAPDYPLQKKRATVEFLRTQQHLRPRTNLFRAVFRVRSVAAASIHRFFQDRGFVYVHTPVITASDCEGAGEMFRVTTFDPAHAPRVSEEAAAASGGALVAGETDWSQDFFGEAASLTVSGQLNAENFAMAFGDVYTFGPTFRAENSNTARHAAEFWMVEPEMAFADLNDDMDVAEAMLKYVIEDVMERCPDELAMLNKFVDKGLLERLRHVAGSDFARITYTEAIDILLAAQEAGHAFEFPVEWGIDLQTEHERYLTEEHFRCPTFVTDYPAAIKAFYMRLNDDGRTVAAMDCLVPGIGEIVGGSQREERLEVLERRIEELGMDAEDYRAYLDLRRFGTCSHAGFGLGFERMVMYLTGVSNIRDVIPHPRTVGNAAF